MPLLGDAAQPQRDPPHTHKDGQEGRRGWRCKKPEPSVKTGTLRLTEQSLHGNQMPNYKQDLRLGCVRFKSYTHTYRINRVLGPQDVSLQQLSKLWPQDEQC